MSRATVPHRIVVVLLSCLVAAVATPAVVAVPAASAKVLRQGATGKLVKRLQRRLHIAADGQWGRATTRALKRFQRAAGLTATGRLDAQTRQRLGWVTATAPGTVKATPGVAATPAQVKQVQAALGVTADGEWGPQSAKALKAWEAANGLVPDGVIDADVLAKLAPAAAAAPAPAAAPAGSAAAIVAAARAQVGAPYRTGGTTPAGFDCSGLTQYVFKQAGIRLKRTSFQQFTQGTAVERSEIAPGDLVFFSTAGAGASHVGVATSARTVISATSRGVMEHRLDDAYWGAHYVGARRITGE